MATIVTRKGVAGPSFQARLRLTRDGELIHKESKTFATKAAAKSRAQGREVELTDPKTLAVAVSGGTCTLATLVRWYIETFETISPWQRSKQSALEFLERHPIGQLDPLTVTADVLINHIRQRRLGGAGPSTAANDLIWIRIVLDAAKIGQRLPIPMDAVDEAREYCLKHRLIAKSTRRERRPTNKELEKLDGYFQIRDRHKATVVPMRCTMWVGITSTVWQRCAARHRGQRVLREHHQRLCASDPPLHDKRARCNSNGLSERMTKVARAKRCHVREIGHFDLVAQVAFNKLTDTQLFPSHQSSSPWQLSVAFDRTRHAGRRERNNCRAVCAHATARPIIKRTADTSVLLGGRTTLSS